MNQGDAAPEGEAGQQAPQRATSEPRIVRAMLFADVKGFSVLNDEQLLSFAKRVLGAFAIVLESHAAISGTGEPGAMRSSWCLLMP